MSIAGPRRYRRTSTISAARVDMISPRGRRHSASARATSIAAASQTASSFAFAAAQPGGRQQASGAHELIAAKDDPGRLRRVTTARRSRVETAQPGCLGEHVQQRPVVGPYLDHRSTSRAAYGEMAFAREGSSEVRGEALVENGWRLQIRR